METNRLLLITGASGFVGSHAVKYALRSQLYDFIIATDVRPADHLVSQEVPNELKFIVSDLTRPDDMELLGNELKKFRDHKIVVWHIGGCFNYSAPRELLYNVNVGGTTALISVLHKAELDIQRLVFWSGAVAYGDFNHPNGKLPATEKYPVRPQEDYGWSKKAAEDILLLFHRDFGMPITIMRLGAIYGPGAQYGMAAALFLNASGQLSPLLVGNKHSRGALIHAEDVVRVADFLSWAEEANGEIYNVVDDGRPMDDIAIFVGTELNNKPFACFHLPGFVLRTLKKLVIKRAHQLGGVPVIDPELGKMTLLNAWVSNEKLMKLAERYGCRKTLLKYPDPLAGLKETIDWYRKKGRL